MMNECPPHKALLAYEDGKLSDSEVAPIEHHLDDCEACQASMGNIREDDRGAQLVRQAFRTAHAQHAHLQDSADESRPKGRSVDLDATTLLLEDAAADTSSDFEDLSSENWIIPDYERVVLCGEGSYGSVWAVRDRVGVFRALKAIDLNRMSRLNIGCRERDALEAYCRNVRGHPHLITVYHVGEVAHLLYYIMDLADDAQCGPIRAEFPAQYHPLTLERVVKRKRLRIDVAIDIIRRLLDGLSVLHSKGLVHRDVKPSNVVFVDRRPQLADIGIMTADSASAQAVGTPAYMPPDNIMDMTADTFATGKMLHEMLAGAKSEALPILPLDMRWQDSGWDHERVSRLILRACSDRACDRYATAAEMLEDLEQCVELTFHSLFEELDHGPSVRTFSTRSEAIQLGHAFLRAIPWVFGILALLLVMWLLANQV